MLEPIDSIREFNSTYWYTGYCPHSGELLKLPRTPQVEQIARELMVQLSLDVWRVIGRDR
jgi:hypothetical protein